MLTSLLVLIGEAGLLPIPISNYTSEFGQLTDSLIAKLLHGKFQSLLYSEGIDTNGSTCWLHQLLCSESECMLCAVQDLVIATRVYEAKIMKKSVTTLF